MNFGKEKKKKIESNSAQLTRTQHTHRTGATHTTRAHAHPSPSFISLCVAPPTKHCRRPDTTSPASLSTSRASPRSLAPASPATSRRPALAPPWLLYTGSRRRRRRSGMPPWRRAARPRLGSPLSLPGTSLAYPSIPFTRTLGLIRTRPTLVLHLPFIA